jgi:DNA-binding MarR family transcriptional regulator
MTSGLDAKLYNDGGIQTRILVALVLAGEPMEVRGIAESLAIQPVVAAANLGRLTARDWVRKVRTEGDWTRYEITQAGRQARDSPRQDGERRSD